MPFFFFIVTVSPRNSFTVNQEVSREQQEINYAGTDWSRECFLLHDRGTTIYPFLGSATSVLVFQAFIFSPSS